MVDSLHTSEIPVCGALIKVILPISSFFEACALKSKNGVTKLSVTRSYIPTVWKRKAVMLRWLWHPGNVPQHWEWSQSYQIKSWKSNLQKKWFVSRVPDSCHPHQPHPWVVNHGLLCQVFFVDCLSLHFCNIRSSNFPPEFELQGVQGWDLMRKKHIMTFFCRPNQGFRRQSWSEQLENWRQGCRASRRSGPIHQLPERYWIQSGLWYYLLSSHRSQHTTKAGSHAGWTRIIHLQCSRRNHGLHQNISFFQSVQQ